MVRLAIVRGTAEGNLLVRKAEAVGGPALDHGQALEGLDGGARVDGGGDAALRSQDAACPVHHREGAAVAAFDDFAAGDFGDDRIDHDARSLWGEWTRYQAKAASWAMRKRPIAQL